MRNMVLVLILISISIGIKAQEINEENNRKNNFEFSIIKEVPITSVKNQASSGTCWSFSCLGMIEAELLREGKGEYDLSEMFIVHKNYQDKAKKFIRMQGKTNFGAGGSFADVLDAIRDYGIVPESSMEGLNYGEERHKHAELDALTESYVNALIKNPNKKLSTAWFEGYKGILDAYLGKCPDFFTYNNKEYNPRNFASYLGIDPNNFISITSFTHHPFYEAFPIEVQDNWRWALSFNLPLEEMMQVINSAIEQNYTVAWASDVSEKGFSRKGIAIVPDFEAKEGIGSDQAHWLGLNQKEKEDYVSNPTNPVPEKIITQEIRQNAFDNYETTDDHGMLIYGQAKDQNGTLYYLVKNSWGTDNPYNGSWYASESFVRYKTISIVVNKDALPKEIRKKLNL